MGGMFQELRPLVTESIEGRNVARPSYLRQSFDRGNLCRFFRVAALRPGAISE
jgi:hypothetical protein